MTIGRQNTYGPYMTARVLLIVTSLCLVALLAAGAQASGSATGGIAAKAAARDRTTSDLPDDISGPQVHFLYVVPSDGADRQLDMKGEVDQSIALMERWLVGQTGNQTLRIDTRNGVPDITFLRLRHSDAQAADPVYGPNGAIAGDLVAAGFNDPGKVYAVIYDGHGSLTCGNATQPPGVPKLATTFLLGNFSQSFEVCSGNPHGYGPGTNRAGFSEIVLLHEIMHTIGFAPSCAPHVTNDIWHDHVNDSQHDLMFGLDSTHPGLWDWAHVVLDVNHDDYYRANVPGCPDLSNSPYLQIIPSFTLAVAIHGHGSVGTLIESAYPAKRCKVTCTFTALRSSAVTLSATPVAGSRFVSWSGGCSGRGDCQLTMTGSTSVTATFAAKPKPKCRKGQKSTKKHPCRK